MFVKEEIKCTVCDRGEELCGQEDWSDKWQWDYERRLQQEMYFGLQDI